MNVFPCTPERPNSLTSSGHIRQVDDMTREPYRAYSGQIRRITHCFDCGNVGSREVTA